MNYKLTDLYLKKVYGEAIADGTAPAIGQPKMSTRARVLQLSPGQSGKVSPIQINGVYPIVDRTPDTVTLSGDGMRKVILPNYLVQLLEDVDEDESGDDQVDGAVTTESAQQIGNKIIKLIKECQSMNGPANAALNAIKGQAEKLVKMRRAKHF